MEATIMGNMGTIGYIYICVCVCVSCIVVSGRLRVCMDQLIHPQPLGTYCRVHALLDLWSSPTDGWI